MLTMEEIGLFIYLEEQERQQLISDDSILSNEEDETDIE